MKTDTTRTVTVVLAFAGLTMVGAALVLGERATHGSPVASLALSCAFAGVVLLGTVVSAMGANAYRLQLDVRRSFAPRADPRDLPPLKVPAGGRGPATVLDVDPPPARCPVCDKLQRLLGGALRPCRHPAEDPDDSEVASARRLRRHLDQA